MNKDLSSKLKYTMTIVIGIVMFLASIFVATAETYDSFNDSSIDPELWHVELGGNWTNGSGYGSAVESGDSLLLDSAYISYASGGDIYDWNNAWHSYVYAKKNLSETQPNQISIFLNSIRAKWMKSTNTRLGEATISFIDLNNPYEFPKYAGVQEYFDVPPDAIIIKRQSADPEILGNVNIQVELNWTDYTYVSSYNWTHTGEMTSATADTYNPGSASVSGSFEPFADDLSIGFEVSRYDDGIAYTDYSDHMEIDEVSFNTVFVPPPPEPFSEDTDGGIIVNQVGTATNGTEDYYGNRTINVSETDVCINSTFLTEYYVSNNNVNSTQINCTAEGYDECSNGACKDVSSGGGGGGAWPDEEEEETVEVDTTQEENPQLAVTQTNEQIELGDFYQEAGVLFQGVTSGEAISESFQNIKNNYVPELLMTLAGTGLLIFAGTQVSNKKNTKRKKKR